MAWQPSLNPTVQGRWRARVEELEALGEPVRVVAARHKCSAGSLSKWRVWFRRQAEEPVAPTSFVEVKVAAPRPSRSGGGDGMVVELVNGRRVYLGSGFEPDALRRLVAVLDRS